MDALGKGWFSELSPLWPGQCMSLEVEEVLYNQRSEYQHVVVFRSKTYGNVLVLDGVIQATERDECSYQEMITHLPMFAHPNPKKVLVVGGGDGGVVREVLKHESVESVVHCELDKMVIEVSQKYLPQMAKHFGHPKVTLHIGDGAKFMEEHQNEFDVIITDSSDPIGPAEALFERPYYECMKGALTDNGVLCTQGECLWLHLELIKEMQTFCRTLFPEVAYGFTTIPTYPSGQIGFTLCGKSKDTPFATPVRMPTAAQVETMDLKYYNADVHKAAFVLPEFARKALAK